MDSMVPACPVFCPRFVFGKHQVASDVLLPAELRKGPKRQVHSRTDTWETGVEEQAAMALQIEHTHLPIRGLNLHVAHVGKVSL